MNNSTVKRQCWICYAEEDSTAFQDGDDCYRWVRPCRCRGSTAWAHQVCLLQWVNNLSPDVLLSPRVSCPQCLEMYEIEEHHVLPRWLLQMVDVAIQWRRESLIWVAAGGALVSLYVVCFSYGVGAVGVLCGTRELLTMQAMVTAPRKNFAEAITALKSLVGIPLVPLYILSMRFSTLGLFLYPLVPFLVYRDSYSLRFIWPLPMSTIITLLPLGRLFWTDLVQNGLMRGLRRRLVPGLPKEAYSFASSIESTTLSEAIDEGEESESFTHLVVSTAETLFFPFLAAGLGYLIAPRMATLNRSIVGGIIILMGREVVKTALWYQRAISKNTRRILNRK